MPSRPGITLPAGTTALPADSRPDSEILAALLTPPTAVPSEQNVWAFWDAGFARMPAWRQRNVLGWARKFPRSWTVRVLDAVEGSPAHFSHFLDVNELPQAVREGTMTGRHAPQHLSDLVRLPLLLAHGGIYLDVGFMLYGDLARALWAPIADEASPTRVALIGAIHRQNGWAAAGNNCIAARRGEPAIRRWHDVMRALWADGRTSCEGILEHRLFADVPTRLNVRVLGEKSPEELHALLEYSHQGLAWERLKMTVEPDRGWDGPAYVRQHVLLLDPVAEVWAALLMAKVSNDHLFALLSCAIDPGAESVEGSLPAQARALVEHVVARSTMMQMSSGHGFQRGRMLAEMWDGAEREGVDVVPGTYGEWLRYAGERVDQRREVKTVELGVHEGPVIRGALV